MAPSFAIDSIHHIVQQQRDFFQTGTTRSVDFRLQQLNILKQAIAGAQADIIKALKADLNKPEFEAYATEIGVLQEVNSAIKQLRSWVKPKKVKTPMMVFPGSARIYPDPLGVVLIISPWNYPFYLAIAPLVGAIAAGNCAIIKPSEVAPRTSQLLANLIRQHFDPAYISVAEGGAETSQVLLEQRFDHIFFTGGTEIGKIVMAAAAKHLTPVTLELGGKSPCIVDAEIPVEDTAKRIVWGKFVNAGQTCVAPDYLLVDQRIKSDLLAAIKKQITEFYGDHPAKSPDYARIVSDRHFSRLSQLLQTGQIAVGGETDAADRYIAPTIVDGVSWDDPVMQDEIFGPILPILEYRDLSDAIATINQKPKPLALYFFSTNKQHQARVLQETTSGGVCINDTILQLAVEELPFGGVGSSGMGSYHGKASFDTFSHQKSVLTRSFWLDAKWRYAPYGNKLNLLKRMFG